MIRVLIISEDQEICDSSKNYLSCKKDIVLLGDCGDIEMAETIINYTKPDLILLDVELIYQKKSNFLKRIYCQKRKIICLAISHERALPMLNDGFPNYILKPLEEDELLRKIGYIINQSEIDSLKLEKADNFLLHNKKNILLSTIEGIYVVNFNDLMYCKSDKGYTTFYLANKKEILVSKSIKDYESLLPIDIFVRIHQSFIVNINFIYLISKELKVILKNSEELPISHRKKKDIINIIRNC